MGIPLSEVIDGDNASMREQASDNNLPYEPFTMRELITPQYRPDEVGLDSSDETWENWVGQHQAERTELRPETRPQLVAAVVRMAHREGEVRAVGAGHSHSDAPAPGGTYIDLNPGDPPASLATDAVTPPTTDGLNDLLDHEGWLKRDDDLKPLGEVGAYASRLTDSFTIKGALDQDHLKRLEAGVMLRRLNRHLLRDHGDRAYALENMGSFDGQTVAGAVNTSTHGTGVTLSSISDAVKSVEIATVPESESGDPIVRLYRIEPTDGVTNRDRFEADTGDHEMELIQDDDVFRSVVVGYGCMGVAYAYTMRVVDNYWLREETELMAWSTLKEELRGDEEDVTEFLTRNSTRHCQIFVNTAAEQVPSGKIQDHEDHGAGQHEDHRDPVCLVKRHKPAAPPDGLGVTDRGTVEAPDPDEWVNASKDQRWPPERRRKPFRDAGKFFLKFHPFSKNHGKARQLHKRFFHPEIRKDQFVGGMKSSVWYVALRRLRDRVGQLPSSEHRHPVPPGPATPTTELGVRVDDVVDAVDAFRKRVREVTLTWGNEDDGFTDKEVFFPAPMGIRFTAASEHYLSPEYDRATAMVELPIPLPGEGKTAGGLKPQPALDHDEMREQVAIPALTEVERHVREEYADLAPRPHMGKHNTVDADWLDENYDHFDASGSDEVETGWYQAYRRFNHFGTFDNTFTAELGLDSFSPAESSEEGTDGDDTEETVQPTDAPTDEATESADDDAETTDRTGPSTEVVGPGFGALTGVAAGVSAAWLLERRVDGAVDADGDGESDGVAGTEDGERGDDADRGDPER